MLSSDTTRADVLDNPAPTVEEALFLGDNNPALEQTLTKPEAQQPGDAPGKFRGNLTDLLPDRDLHLHQSRSHGSFL